LSRSDVRGFLDRHGLQARKDLGQNFLVDEHVAERLALLAGVEPGDCVIEVGTGTGVLTRALAARAERVISFDVDAGLVRALQAEAVLPANVELIHQDVLHADLAAIADSFAAPAAKVRLVSNLPYSISGPMLRKLLDLRHRLTDWSLMLQREVAERLLAGPGSKAYGSLSVLHALCVHTQREMELQPRCFFPEPQVRSLFLRLIPLADSKLAPDELPRLERVVRAAFSKRRKTLVNALRSAGGNAWSADDVRAALGRLGLDVRVRGEALTPEQFLELCRILAELPSEAAGEVTS
jgi:16S rRNA (adenine1518-N6/adenine1519-N6)-dimethyltransferase